MGLGQTSYKDNTGKEYFKVGPGETGASVCSKASRKCVGFTSKDIKLCKQLHPSAGEYVGGDGSSSPFYCDGPPDVGICSGKRNTCGICPACNPNADCNWSPVGTQFREMYVECGPSDVVVPKAAPVSTPPSIPAVTPSQFFVDKETLVTPQPSTGIDSSLFIGAGVLGAGLLLLLIFKKKK